MPFPPLFFSSSLSPLPPLPLLLLPELELSSRFSSEEKGFETATAVIPVTVVAGPRLPAAPVVGVLAAPAALAGGAIGPKGDDPYETGAGHGS